MISMDRPEMESMPYEFLLHERFILSYFRAFFSICSRVAPL